MISTVVKTLFHIKVLVDLVEVSFIVYHLVWTIINQVPLSKFIFLKLTECINMLRP